MRPAHAMNFAIIAMALNFYLVLALGPSLFPPSVFRDDGAVSIFNMMMILGICGAFFLKLLEGPGRLKWLSLSYIAQVYYLREADFHRAFTEKNITKDKFYFETDAPLATKLLAASVFLVLLVAVVHLLWRYWDDIWAALFKRQPWAVSLAVWAGLLLASQFCDKSGLNDSTDWRVKGIEEMLETTSAAVGCCAAWMYVLSPREPR